MPVSSDDNQTLSPSLPRDDQAVASEATRQGERDDGYAGAPLPPPEIPEPSGERYDRALNNPDAPSPVMTRPADNYGLSRKVNTRSGETTPAVVEAESPVASLHPSSSRMAPAAEPATSGRPGRQSRGAAYIASLKGAMRESQEEFYQQQIRLGEEQIAARESELAAERARQQARDQAQLDASRQARASSSPSRSPAGALARDQADFERDLATTPTRITPEEPPATRPLAASNDRGIGATRPVASREREREVAPLGAAERPEAAAPAPAVPPSRDTPVATTPPSDAPSARVIGSHMDASGARRAQDNYLASATAPATTSGSAVGGLTMAPAPTRVAVSERDGESRGKNAPAEKPVAKNAQHLADLKEEMRASNEQFLQDFEAQGQARIAQHNEELATQRRQIEAMYQAQRDAVRESARASAPSNPPAAGAPARAPSSTPARERGSLVTDAASLAAATGTVAARGLSGAVTDAAGGVASPGVVASHTPGGISTGGAPAEIATASPAPVGPSANFISTSSGAMAVPTDTAVMANNFATGSVGGLTMAPAPDAAPAAESATALTRIEQLRAQIAGMSPEDQVALNHALRTLDGGGAVAQKLGLSGTTGPAALPSVPQDVMLGSAQGGALAPADIEALVRQLDALAAASPTPGTLEIPITSELAGVPDSAFRFTYQEPALTPADFGGFEPVAPPELPFADVAEPATFAQTAQRFAEQAAGPAIPTPAALLPGEQLAVSSSLYPPSPASEAVAASASPAAPAGPAGTTFTGGVGAGPAGSQAVVPAPIIDSAAAGSPGAPGGFGGGAPLATNSFGSSPYTPGGMTPGAQSGIPAAGAPESIVTPSGEVLTPDGEVAVPGQPSTVAALQARGELGPQAGTGLTDPQAPPAPADNPNIDPRARGVHQAVDGAKNAFKPFQNLGSSLIGRLPRALDSARRAWKNTKRAITALMAILPSVATILTLGFWATVLLVGAFLIHELVGDGTSDMNGSPEAKESSSDNCLSVEKAASPPGETNANATTNNSVKYSITIMPQNTDQQTAIWDGKCEDKWVVTCQKNGDNCTNQEKNLEDICNQFKSKLDGNKIPEGGIQITDYAVNYPGGQNYEIVNTFTINAHCEPKEKKEGDEPPKQKDYPAVATTCVNEKATCDNGEYCWPVSGRVSQIPFQPGGLSHSKKDSVDISRNDGQKVYAPFDGTYTYKWDSGDSSGNTGCGCYAYSYHDGKLFMFCHMVRSICRGFTGQRSIKKGQVIGVVDSSGRITGPHLHLEVGKGFKNPFPDRNPSKLEQLFNGGKRLSEGNYVTEGCSKYCSSNCNPYNY